MKSSLLRVLPALCFGLIGYGLKGAEAQKISNPAPLRELSKDQDYDLRVLYVEDSRLPEFAASKRVALYAKLEQKLLAVFGYRARLREIGHRSVSEFFTANEASLARYAGVIRTVDIDVSTGPGEVKLRQVIKRALARQPLELIQRHLGTLPLASKAEAEAAAFRQFDVRLKELRNIKLEDGTRFFEPAEARQTTFITWAVLLKELKEADLVFTNSMIIGADIEMPLYVIARGGLTTGFTNNNLHSPQQAVVQVSLFPFLSDAPVFLRERGRIPPDELLDVIATFTLHELGHYFLRRAEHYDHPHCVHVAPIGLGYYEWYKSLRARAPCSLEHRKLLHY